MPATDSPILWWLFKFLSFLIFINIVLAVFNLLPVPPLDGSKVLAGLLPERHMNIVFTLDRYGFFILILLMWLGLTSRIIGPIVIAIFRGMTQLVGLGDIAYYMLIMQ
jgi:Zn-dependent protease